MQSKVHGSLIQRLEQRRGELGEELAPRSGRCDISDPHARVVDLQEHRDASQSRTTLRVELGRIDAALERQRRGQYGLCCSCELEIEPERLVEDPSAAFCEPCYGDVVEERKRQGYRVR